MKLELKHLAPYLPYGLHIKHNDGARLIICGAFKKYNADDFFYYSLLNWMTDVKSIEAKPILRPISDLKERIEFKNRLFTPMEVVGDEPNDFCEFDFVTDWSEKGNDFNQYVDEFIDRVYDNHHLDYLPFSFIQKLFEWHFDVFGLIDLGLAIDINTLKNE